MSFGGGSTTQTQSLPPWLEDAAKANLSRANYVAQLGYVPQYGLDVAAFSPMQQSAMQNTANAASAFGLLAPTDAMSGMPQAQTNAQGFSGYSSGNLFDDSMSQLQQRRPAQYDAMMGMFIDPRTGQASTAFTPVGSIANTGAANTVQNMVNYGSGANASDMSGEQSYNLTQGLQDLADAPNWIYALPFVGAAKGAATAYVNDQARKMNEAGGSSTPYLYTDRGFESGNVYNAPTTPSTSSTPRINDTYTTSWGDSRTGTKSYTVAPDGSIQATYSSGFSPETAAGLSIASSQNDTKSYQDDWAEPDGTITGDSNSSSSSSGTYCCTAMRKNGDWTSPKRLYRMHKWHYDQSQWWRDGYDVWGKVLADNLLTEKGNVWSKIMNAFYEHRVAKKPATVKSVIADIMVYPAVFVIGMAAKLKGKHVDYVEVGE